MPDGHHLIDPATYDLFGGRRVSAARRSIAQAAVEFGGAFTVDELHASVIGPGPGIGIATVYRAVTAMLEAGSLACVGSRDGRTLYALCGGGAHHHHLVCTGCGTVTGIACPVDGELELAARRAGYTVTSHDVTLYGLCGTCSRGRT